ncbi:hypothetical protein DAPPUDRAFT_233641 [Daphnia pulex]|uniref:Uncharacterized protein n=1 Tax=Daphnia pulex TaxID=6669 RepID=E9FVC2_DAPPU|nr:hypothetical protein DAPPUDRAFT_233641 [Daphnia pulex]|eukprot:EFX88532.1 hypothetical protein DAPPUDRAFT_233641 [Daphnia pulex]
MFKNHDFYPILRAMNFQNLDAHQSAGNQNDMGEAFLNDPEVVFQIKAKAMKT